MSTSASESYQDAQKWIPQGSPFIISNITITKSALNQLLALPRGTKALLVNLNLKMALEVIADLHHMGVNHIKFIPFYPFANPVADVDLAITPDELRYVPTYIKRVINLGQRTFDTSTIVEIAIKLNCEDPVSYTHLMFLLAVSSTPGRTISAFCWEKSPLDTPHD